MELTIHPLEKKFERSNFNCGYEKLDDYLKKQAKQDVNRDLSACFVLADLDNMVRGYYTLSSNSVKREEFPEDLVKKLPPRYGDLPTVLLGRLATDVSIQGQGWGEILLLHALNKCHDLTESMGILAVVVDPIDEKAATFYSKYGFILLPTSGKMFLPMKTIAALVQ